MSPATVDKNTVIACLRKLTDVDFQQREWVHETDDDAVPPLGELAATLFDVSGFDAALQARDAVVFDHAIDRLARELRREFAALPRDKRFAQIIELDSWRRIRRLAERILELIGYRHS